VAFTGDDTEFDLHATSVKHLFALLIERHPALARHLEEGVVWPSTARSIRTRSSSRSARTAKCS
jgi:hypothetical protein